jgi:hypothetical protein
MFLYAGIVVFIWLIIISVLLVYLWLSLRPIFSSRGRGVKQTIQDSILKNDTLLSQIKNLTTDLMSQKEKSKSGLQKIGLVRFNPFDRIGGTQSYSLAVLNLKGSGAVITFLYTRTGVRIYVKEIQDYKNKEKDTELTKEEKKAIQEASLI